MLNSLVVGDNGPLGAFSKAKQLEPNKVLKADLAIQWELTGRYVYMIEVPTCLLCSVWGVIYRPLGALAIGENTESFLQFLSVLYLL